MHAQYQKPIIRKTKTITKPRMEWVTITTTGKKPKRKLTPADFDWVYDMLGWDKNWKPPK